ncbi:HNH endonuclease [Myxococcota bacterium]|nr:HNH endonuclease [Myxococcota bacterium]
MTEATPTHPKLSAMMATLLEKAALDNGFDQELPAEGPWLGYASTHAPLRLWLTAPSKTTYVVALSQLHVAKALEHGAPIDLPLPKGAEAARTVPTTAALHALVRRAFQLSKTLPDELLQTFTKKTAHLPKTTEAERLVIQRVGQDLFRQGLLDYWEGRCALTGLAIPELLRASHIKPWAHCETDAERLDIHNGLLLSPNLDAAFDQGFITLTDEGNLMLSPRLTAEARHLLGLNEGLATPRLTERHRIYLRHHRSQVFAAAGEGR